MKNNNIIDTYGPLLEIDFIKVNILNHLNSLTVSISEEKYLHQHICINVLPTPYKAALEEAKYHIAEYQQKIRISSTIDEVVEFGYNFDHFQNIVQDNLKVAYDKTVFLIAQVRNVAALKDIKGRLHLEVSRRVKSAINKNEDKAEINKDSDNATVTRNDLSPQARGVLIKKNIASIIAKTWKSTEPAKEKNIEEDLLYCAYRLMAGEWEKLKGHFYFEEHTEYLREYRQNEHNLNEKTTKIFLVLQAKKTIMNNPEASKTEIFDKFFKFFGTLMNYDQYRDLIANGVTNLRTYVDNLKRVRAEKAQNIDTNMAFNVPDHKKEMYLNLKNYVNPPPESNPL